MKDETKDKVISEHMRELARKSHAAIRSTPEALERARARAAKARAALKAKREERKAAGAGKS
jgi:hypothetical protein